MAPIEIVGWFLSAFLTICFISSVLFILKKPKLFSESDSSFLQKNYEKAKSKSNRLF
ncbi:hypothetical protein [Domibacillus indicus]|uniref:hypothetical protein n=1 Tax=Domibacillus indicus TaxID=1437523 RepID=UPI000A81A4E0|nr:hypothetical protein [Domibacillus indicus]